MKSLFLLVIGVFFLAPLAHAAPLKAENLHFDYETADATLYYQCTHVLENADSQDWTVSCSDDQGKLQKKFTVHLWLTQYDHKSGPIKVSYELLYWITDWTDSRHPLPESTTVWFNFRDVSALDSLEVSLGVDQDLANLHLKIQL